MRLEALREGELLSRALLSDPETSTLAREHLAEIKNRPLSLRKDPLAGPTVNDFLLTWHPDWIEPPTSTLAPRRIDRGEADARYSESRLAFRTTELRAEYRGELVDPLMKRLSPESRERLRIRAFDGRLYGWDGSILGDGEAVSMIYVMDARGNIYVSHPEQGKFHHSTFLQGGPVAGAGQITFRDGKITRIDHQSGHYRPTVDFLNQVVHRFQELGVEVPEAPARPAR